MIPLIPETFPLARGVPMHLLTELGLNEAFLEVVDEHRRDGRPVVIRRNGAPCLVPADELTLEVAATRKRIAELEAEIAAIRESLARQQAP